MREEEFSPIVARDEAFLLQLVNDG